MKKIAEKKTLTGFGILISHADGVSGWMTGEDGKPLLWPSSAEAERAMKKIKANKKYSWNCQTTVSEYQN